MKKEEIPLGHEAITWQMQSVIAGDSQILQQVLKSSIYQSTSAYFFNSAAC